MNAQDVGDRDRDDVANLFVEAITTARRAGHHVVRAQAVGRLMITRSPPPSALSHARAELEEAFGLIQQLGDRRNAAHTAIGVGALALAARDQAAAASWFDRALDITVAIGYWYGVVWTMMGVNQLAARAGRLREGAASTARCAPASNRSAG